MLMIAAILIPVAAGIAISAIPMEDRTRKILYACSVLLTDAVAVLAVMGGGTLRLSELSEGVAIIFRADTLGRCFLAVTILLYTSVLFYSFEYMKMEERIPTFYAFYLVSMGALIAECFAGNLVTMYLSFEFLTLTSMPLVLHERTKEAVAAGLKYLFYSVAGAMMGLLAIFFVYHFAKDPELFVYGGFLDPAKYTGAETVLLTAVLAGIVGFGAKAGMYPLHGWLPTAHPIAPAPASALLSAMIAKGGVLAVIRLVYFSVGDEILRGTWAQYAWMCLATLTILMGSTMAFGEENLKKRLAYSTVSQISYIMLSLSLLTDAGLRGGLLHVFSHACAKGCLFLVAGVFIYKLRIRRVTELMGIGKTMPLTLACFTAASISLVGIPPMGGFTSKWAIATAAMDSGTGIFEVLGPVVLLISALLTAGYLLPVMVDGYFPGAATGYEDEKKAEPGALMLVPMFILCAGSLLVGIFGSSFMGGLTF